MTTARTQPKPFEVWLFDGRKPLDVGKKGLALATALSLILAFVFLTGPIYAMFPPGRYPKLILMLPFLLVSGAAYFVLSPVFYAVYLLRGR